MSKGILQTKSIKSATHRKELSLKELTDITSHYVTLKNASKRFKQERESANFGSPKYIISTQAIQNLETESGEFYAKHHEILDSDRARTIAQSFASQLTIKNQQKLIEIRNANPQLATHSKVEFALFGKPNNLTASQTVATTPSRQAAFAQLFKDNKENNYVDSNAPTFLEKSLF